MIGKSVKRIIVKRVLPAVLAVSMVIGVAEWRNLKYTRANAATSLPGIVNILSNLDLVSGNYKILEVVPDDDKGVFGYYVAGQESTKFEDTLRSRDSIASRTQWANDYLKSLQDKGILSDDDKAPLTDSYKGDTLYKELYPWETASSDDYKVLSLDRTETVRVNGTYQHKDGGAFSVAASSYEFVGNGKGEYVQKVDFSNPIDLLDNTIDQASFEAEKNNYIFYKPTFKLVSKSEVNQIDRSSDDTLVHFSGEKELPVYSVNADGDKEFDLAASQDREFKIGADYYAIESLTDVKPGYTLADTDTWSSLKKDGWYASKVNDSDGFTESANGYFRLNLDSLKYVGEGNGSYTLTDATPAPDGRYSVEYSEIRYQGGYTNNNWFLRHILDCSETADLTSLSSRIRVDTVTAGNIPTDLKDYGLVVISHGFDANAQVHLSSDNKAALSAYIANKGAVLVDLSADDDNELLNQLGVSDASDATKNPDGLVAKSVFAFRPGTDARKGVVTADLTTKYHDTEYQTEGSSFYEVSKNIADENFLRRQKNRNTTDLLSEDVSMASCIRYIISYNESSVRNNKKKIKILEISPNDESEIAPDGKLSADAKKWFGSSYQGEGDVTVTTMSTRELVGHTEDISENYDLVYIGKGRNVNTDYNDNDMDGLYYYNIGDTVNMDQTVGVGNKPDYNSKNKAVTAGMYAKDFEITNRTDNIDGHGGHYIQTDRYSGNDITEKKQKELDAFIKSGHPVIVSDDLMSGSVFVDQTITAALKEKLSISYNNGVTLTATPSYDGCGDIKGLVSYEYQWYKRNQYYGSWEPISGATSVSYTVPEKWYDSNLEFVCRISSVNVAGQTYAIDTDKQPSSGSVVISYKKSKIEDTGKGSGFQQSRTVDNLKKWNTAPQHVSIDYASGKNNLGTLTVDGTNQSAPGDSWIGEDNYEVMWFSVDENNDNNKKNTDVSGKDVHYYNSSKSYEWSNVKTGRTTNVADWSDGSRIQAAAYFGNNKNPQDERGWIRLFSDVYVVHPGYNGCNTKTRTGNASFDISVKGGSYNKVRADKIDHYTKLYSLLNDNNKAENVWSSAAAKLDSASVVRHVNISTPEIVETSYVENGATKSGFPAQYTENIKDSDCLGDEMKLNFKIVNTTDPSPDSTTYSAAIYFDKDGNGLFNETEMAQDVYVAGGDGKDGINYVSSMKGALTETDAQSYTAAVTLPEGMTGAINWKLVITQNPDDESTNTEYMPHTSVNRISYKKSAGKQTINVLQINAKYHNDGINATETDDNKYNLEMETDDPDGSKNTQTEIGEYGKWLNQPQVTDKYNINIVTVTTDDFNNMQYSSSRTDERKIENDGMTYTVKANDPIILGAYNMLIIGFSNNYNYLNRDACYRIQEFADSGKSVLFTHDNSSHAYIPSNSENPAVSDTGIFSKYNYSGSSTKDNAYTWGAFNFNTILRSVDKMDVYGITDTVNGFGGVSGWQQTMKDGKTPVTTGILASQDPNEATSAISASDIENLKSKGYSIAYKPSSKDTFDPGDVQTVPQTQGYSDLLLYRFSGNRDKIDDKDAGLIVNSVRQVNTGTITTYPYELNADGLNSTGFDVSQTHMQYYQLNMNSDNIVVWYTLNGGRYSRKDCINNYYIFSCDNIFYTGAGHTYNPTEGEVKLFINTMIAAYRQQATKPKAYFTGSAKNSNRVSSYLVSTGAKPLTAVDVLRSYIEDFTGIDTSRWDDAAFMGMKPMDEELHMTKEEIDVAAKAAALRIAYSMTGNPGDYARANAEALAYGPVVDNDETNQYIDLTKSKNSSNANGDLKIKYLTDSSTIGDICLGINRIVCNNNVTSNDVSIPNLKSDNIVLNDQKYYFTVRDNNNSNTKDISVKFYLYSKDKLSDDAIDKNTYKESEEKKNDTVTGYYYDITDKVTVADGTNKGLKSNAIYTIKLDDDNPALKELSSKGTVTIAIEPKVSINGKTLTGEKSKATINTAGLLALG